MRNRINLWIIVLLLATVGVTNAQTKATAGKTKIAASAQTTATANTQTKTAETAQTKTLALNTQPAGAQTTRTANAQTETAETAQTKILVLNTRPSSSTGNLIDATRDYKASSQDLVRLQEEEIRKATEKSEQLRQLVGEGLVARNELMESEESLRALQASLRGTRQQIADSDHMIAEIQAADELAKTQATGIRSRARSLVTPTMWRYNGASNWSLINLAGLQAFFTSKFGRPLPTSAVGQSPIHNRLGYDHRNAVDVALHPDSVEGKALITYLQSLGVPFLAFRTAVPGVATGPHIHVGAPSHRLV